MEEPNQSIIEIEKEVLILKQDFGNFIENNKLVQRLKQCSEIILSTSLASVEEKYQALAFISENEEFYHFLRNNPCQHFVETFGRSFVYFFKEKEYDFYDINADIYSVIDTKATFKMDFGYMFGQWKRKVSILQMEKFIRFVFAQTDEQLAKHATSNLTTIKEEIQSWNPDGKNVEDYIAIFKEKIVKSNTSSISFAIDSVGDEYNPRSIYI